MTRDKTVSISLDEEEYKELKERAIEAHLRLASYCRSQLFMRQIIPNYLPITEIGIKRLKNTKPPPDPYAAEKKESYTIFKAAVVGELTTALSKGRYLNPIPKKIKKEMKERKEERKHEINKAQKIIKKQNIKAGIINGVDDDW